MMLTVLRRTLALAPAALAVAALAVLGGCSAVTALNALTPTNGYVRTADIAYGPGPRMRLDVYVPTAGREVQPAQRPPVVVFFYGGNWVEGSKNDYTFVAQALATAGIITVIADYRLYPDAPYPVFLEDCAAALAWAFDNIERFGGDPAHVVVAGHSAGAYNAAMLAYDPRWLARAGVDSKRLAGFVGIAGPYNFLPIENPTTQKVFDWPNTAPDSLPIHHVSSDAPPTLLIVAERDGTVSPEQNTYPLAEALRAAGVLVEIHHFAHVSHGTLIASMASALRPLAPVATTFATFVLDHGGRAAGQRRTIVR